MKCLTSNYSRRQSSVVLAQIETQSRERESNLFVHANNHWDLTKFETGTFAFQTGDGVLPVNVKNDWR